MRGKQCVGRLQHWLCFFNIHQEMGLLLGHIISVLCECHTSTCLEWKGLKQLQAIQLQRTDSTTLGNIPTLYSWVPDLFQECIVYCRAWACSSPSVLWKDYFIARSDKAAKLSGGREWIAVVEALWGPQKPLPSWAGYHRREMPVLFWFSCCFVFSYIIIVHLPLCSLVLKIATEVHL